VGVEGVGEGAILGHPDLKGPGLQAIAGDPVPALQVGGAGPHERVLAEVVVAIAAAVGVGLPGAAVGVLVERAVGGVDVHLDPPEAGLRALHGLPRPALVVARQHPFAVAAEAGEEEGAIGGLDGEPAGASHLLQGRPGLHLAADGLAQQGLIGLRPLGALAAAVSTALAPSGAGLLLFFSAGAKPEEGQPSCAHVRGPPSASGWAAAGGRRDLALGLGTDRAMLEPNPLHRRLWSR
jgi:hypothetical protein